jgi:hypothetical protein
MQMAVKDDDLVVATHGRGFWIMDNIAYLRGITPEVVSAQAHLFEVVPALRRLRGGRGWARIKSSNVGRNPPRGVVIDYFLAQEPTTELTLTITDVGGEIVREFSSASEDGVRPPANAGMNRFTWDMRYPGTQLPPSAGALTEFESVDHSPPSRPVARPGPYAVRLTVDGQDQEQPFEVRKDPRVEASDADLRAQFELLVDIRDRVSEVADVVVRLREVRARIEERRAGLPQESVVEVGRVMQELEEIEGGLTVWMGSEAHPMMWGPPGLIQKLSRLSGAVVMADAEPTPSMYAVFEDLSERFEVLRNRLDQISEEELGPSPPL